MCHVPLLPIPIPIPIPDTLPISHLTPHTSHLTPHLLPILRWVSDGGEASLQPMHCVYRFALFTNQLRSVCGSS
jgi:hypothetical protein